MYLIGGYNKNKIKNEKQKKFSFCVITYQFRAKLLLLGANSKGRGSVKKIIDLTFLCLAICRGCRGILQEKDSKNETVCITQDFAMKFLPIQFREAQSDFFGKRGLSWHVAVVLRKNVSGQLESQSFIHILEKRLQDSQTVVPIMAHVLTCLKKQHPEIVEAYYRQDNAGCYHSASTILASKLISKRSGIIIRQMDFSDPQGGKGSADRKSAQIKCHVKAFINQGNSVTTAREFEKAILSRGGIQGVKVAVVNTETIQSCNAPKLPGISQLNNFTFSIEGITARRAYEIGEGKFSPWSSLDGR